jgi:hypothetical protein
MKYSTTVSIELGDTEYEIDVGVDYDREGSEVYLDNIVNYTTASGCEITTLGVFLLTYAAARDLSLIDAARCLDDECLEQATDQLET